MELVKDILSQPYGGFIVGIYLCLAFFTIAWVSHWIAQIIKHIADWIGR